MSSDFAAIATQYATDVTEGKEVACKWIKLACKRHLNDLARAAASRPPRSVLPKASGGISRANWMEVEINLVPDRIVEWAAFLVFS